MAVYITIIKLVENEELVDYSFSPDLNGESKGMVRLFKSDGKIIILTDALSDDEGLYGIMACRKLIQHFQKGEFPNRTCWAS